MSSAGGAPGPTATPSPFGTITPADMTASYSNTIIIVNCVVAVLALLAAVLRVVVRRVTRQSFWWDDWLLFVAVPLALGNAVASSYAAGEAMGRHVYALPLPELQRGSKAFIAAQMIWAVSLPLIKNSVLLLYVRIFGLRTYIRRWAWALGTINVAWGLMVVIVCTVQCIPLAALWTPSITDKRCIDDGLFFILGSIPDFAIDLLILALPIPAVWALHAPRVQRLCIVGVFLLGSFTCVTSIIRFSQLCLYGTDPDVTWAMGYLNIWSGVEACVSIMAACLPTLWPLVLRVFPALRPGGNSHEPSDAENNGEVEHVQEKKPARHFFRPFWASNYGMSVLETKGTGGTGSDATQISDDTAYATPTEDPPPVWNPQFPVDHELEHDIIA